MLVRSLLLLGLCLVSAQLLSAAPTDPADHQETLLSQEGDQLPLESSDNALVRDKRTIGLLRQAFPTVSQIIDRKIQAITRLLFRLIGRLVLRGGGGGGGGGNSDSSDDDNSRRVQITLPTFPPSEDDDEDDEDEDSTGLADDSTTTTTEPAPRFRTLTRMAESEDENSVAESRVEPVVVKRRTRQVSDLEASADGENDLPKSDEDDTESAESETSEDPRNKRFLNLGGSGGSGGGSGNFLFDIIRLVAGSGTTQNQDEADNAPVDDGGESAGKGDDGYSAGVPGPLTRLFVIANRGIANLIQDLILRLAQTSERIVNFKARLITSII